MKVFQKFIIYLSIFTYLSISILSPLKVYADVPQNQIVVSHQGTWGGYAFNYSLLGKYFTVQDATEIPSSSPNNSQYFYTDDNITFYALSGKDLYTAILNRGIGLVVTGSFLDTLYNGFMQIIQVSDTETHTHMQGALYDSNDTFLGYCVNDISGCYYQQPQPANTPAVDVPDELTDDVYYHYKYVTEDDIPDYITVYPPSISTMQSKTFSTSLNSEIFNTAFQNFLSSTDSNKTYFTAGWNSNNEWWVQRRIFIRDSSQVYFVYNESNDTNWINICNAYGITKDDNSLLYSDAIDETVSSSFSFSCFDKSTNNVISGLENSYAFISQDQAFVTYSASPEGMKIGKFTVYHGAGGSTSNSSLTCLGFGHPYTIYKDASTYTNVKDKDYNPDSFPSSTYINYSPTNDNSFTLSITNIDNSQTNNESIYNDSSQIFYDNSDDDVINNTQINIDIGYIISDYYVEGNPGPDPGPNPDNPDTPDIEDDTVLDAILAALKRFFDVIGKILGTVLAGLLEVIDTILESIAGIMENFTGIIDIFTTMFAWIPSPVPQVLGLGLSICILAAIIKFIRG